MRIRLLLPLMLVALSLFAQDPKAQRPSPPGQATFSFAGDNKKITVDYSRPSMKGRKIMGELVPYDKVWRTGANDATLFTTEANLEFGGAKVPADVSLPSAAAQDTNFSRQSMMSAFSVSVPEKIRTMLSYPTPRVSGRK